MTGGQHSPILDPVGTDATQPAGEGHQRFAAMGRDVPAGGWVALHRDRATGKEEVNHSERGGETASPTKHTPPIHIQHLTRDVSRQRAAEEENGTRYVV
jgi:hypothetical protein